MVVVNLEKKFMKSLLFSSKNCKQKLLPQIVIFFMGTQLECICTTCYKKLFVFILFSSVFSKYFLKNKKISHAFSLKSNNISTYLKYESKCIIIFKENCHIFYRKFHLSCNKWFEENNKKQKWKTNFRPVGCHTMCSKM